jgi:predicted phosphodiesterase
MQNFSRRQFLAAAASGLVLPAVARPVSPRPAAGPVAFFLIGDTHFLADKAEPKRLDPRSAAVTSRLVDTLNKLPGTQIAKEAGGGIVLAPRGVIHAGDVIDTGDKRGGVTGEMQQTEWAAFAETYGQSGKDGRLKVPVYEIHGNHDSPAGDGLAVKKMIERNKTRPGLINVSGNGLHYSWDWEKVHFVNLGIVVGQVASVARKRRYNPLDSLAFLVADLKEKVGTSGRPVVITHHVDMQRYAIPLPVEDKVAQGREWDPADVRGYFEAIQAYNIAAILYGHTHVRNVFRWDGTAKRSAAGVPVFNVDNSSHFSGPAQAFFYFEISDDCLTAREYLTADGWETGQWATQVWTVPVPKAPA